MRKALIPNKVEYCIFDRSFTNSTGEYARYKHNDPSILNEIEKNRNAVASIYNADNIVTLKQVHGADVINAQKEHIDAKEIEADGMITNRKGLVLAIQTADCVPVLIFAESGDVVGSLHCGWRSSRAGIVAKAASQFKSDFNIPASDLKAVIGPSIMQASYEVDVNFYNDFLEETNDNTKYFQNIENANKLDEDKFLFDLPAYVAGKLDEQDIEIHTHITEDTYADPAKYPSRRRSFHKNEQYRGSILSTIAIIG